MIELQNIFQHYSVRPILKHISLEVAPGECVGIVGPNGMGKSSLLNVTSGVVTPQKGTVTINGLLRKSSEEAELELRRIIAYLPDKPYLPSMMQLRHFLVTVGELYSIPDERLFEHMDQLITLFNLKEVADSPLDSLSSGQMKKAAICATLITEAPIYLLDEPFSGGLDPAGIMALKKVLRNLSLSQQAIVVITAPVPEILEELVTRVIVLHDGKVLFDETPEDLTGRARTRCASSRDRRLGKLAFPETQNNINDYLGEKTKAWKKKSQDGMH
ncbi:MAG: ABC transporter ATP-binding protein [Planctomycetaceae bacterium]